MKRLNILKIRFEYSFLAIAFIFIFPFLVNVPRSFPSSWCTPTLTRMEMQHRAVIRRSVESCVGRWWLFHIYTLKILHFFYFSLSFQFWLTFNYYFFIFTETTIQIIPHTKLYVHRRTIMVDTHTLTTTPEPSRTRPHPRQRHRIRIITATPAMAATLVQQPPTEVRTMEPETLGVMVTCQITMTMVGRSTAVSLSGSTSIMQMRPDITTSATTAGNNIRHTTSLPAAICKRETKMLNSIFT